MEGTFFYAILACISCLGKQLQIVVAWSRAHPDCKTQPAVPHWFKKDEKTPEQIKDGENQLFQPRSDMHDGSFHGRWPRASPRRCEIQLFM